jgi:RNA polymerase sigma factor (sigma-70 family)
MNKFTSILNERRSYNSDGMLKSEITDFINKVKKRIPSKVQDVILLTSKYNILNANDINEIKDSSKSSLPKLAVKYNVEVEKLSVLRDMLRELGNDIKLLPQMMSQAERQALELGKLSMSDLTIDLKTPAGRNAAAKMYMPLVYTIVNQFVGKSNLDKQSLISAGLEGLANAMNDWKGANDGEENTVSFKTYVGFRVRQQILNDINSYGHSLSGGSSYVFKKFGSSLLDAISLDGLPKDEDGDFQNDRLAALGQEDKLSSSEEKDWAEFYAMMEKKFNQRDMNIFYRYFGLNGYKREKSKDIAKSYGMSEGNIRNSILNKMIKYIKNDRRAMDILTNIADTYNENLMVDMLNYDKDMIIETLAGDDIYILLEEMTKWNKKEVFVKDVRAALERMGTNADEKFIVKLLESDFNFADSVLKKYKTIIDKFLTYIYPTENVNLMTDVDKLNKITYIQDTYKKHMKIK